MKIADVIAKRIEIRDEIKRMKEVHANELRPAYEAADQIDQYILDLFRREGVKNFSIDGVGLAYRYISHTVKMSDRAIFRDWVIADELWDEADIKPNKKRAVEFLDKHKRPMPGVVVDGRFTVGYRRAGEPGESEELEE